MQEEGLLLDDEEEERIAVSRDVPVLLVCHRPHLQVTLEELFQLHEVQHVWEERGIIVREFRWKSISRLCFVSGVRNSGNERATVSNIRAVANCGEFDNARIVFVCQNSTKQLMIRDFRVVFPRDWAICVTVDQLEQALGEQLTDEQKRRLERMHLPRPMPPLAEQMDRRSLARGPDHPFYRQRHEELEMQRRRIARLQQEEEEEQEDDGEHRRRAPQEIFSAMRRPPVVHVDSSGRNIVVQGSGRMARLLYNMILQEQAQLRAATQQSMQSYEEERRRNNVNVREEERNQRPWDDIFLPVVPVQEGAAEEATCCACYENYSTIKFIDEAGKCDHIVLCDKCARIIMDREKKCPVCRAIPMTIRRDTRFLPPSSSSSSSPIVKEEEEEKVHATNSNKRQKQK